MGEQGYPFPAVGWQGIFAPVGTPTDVLERFQREANAFQETRELKAALVNLNVEPPPVWSSQRLRELITSDLEVWKRIVQDGRSRWTERLHSRTTSMPAVKSITVYEQKQDAEHAVSIGAADFAKLNHGRRRAGDAAGQ